MDKIGIYYTIFGHNKEIAQDMAKKEGYETIEFAPGNVLRVFQFFVGKRRLAKKARTINPQIEKLNEVFIHGPIWAGKPAPAIIKLIENLELKGKNVSFHFTYTQDFSRTEELINQFASSKQFNLKKIDFVQISENKETE